MKQTRLTRKTPMPRTSAPLRRTPIKLTGGALARRAPAKVHANPPTSRARGNEPSRAVKNAVLVRDDLHCQRCGRDVSAWAYSRQHLLPRGRGGKNTMRNLALVCGSATTPGGCHDEIEHQARRRCTMEGWLVPNGIAPEKWAVWRFGQGWERPTETGWVEMEPHQLQLEWMRDQYKAAA